MMIIWWLCARTRDEFETRVLSDAVALLKLKKALTDRLSSPLLPLSFRRAEAVVVPSLEMELSCRESWQLLVDASKTCAVSDLYSEARGFVLPRNDAKDRHWNELVNGLMGKMCGIRAAVKTPRWEVAPASIQLWTTGENGDQSQMICASCG